MPEIAIKKLKKAAELNFKDKFRKGNIIELPENGSVIMTGDIHGHFRNLERIFAFADLENNPETHLVLHEIIHGGKTDEKGGCLSYKALLKAVEMKIEFPDQVHFLLSNHDTAYITGKEVMKDSRKMNESMDDAIKREFPEKHDIFQQQIKDFLLSQPLAAKTPNGIMLSHSLPATRLIDKFDTDIFYKEIELEDIEKNKPAYLLTWGRRHSQELLDKMTELTNAQIFITGHQPQEKGFKQVGKNMLIIASDHNHGCILKFDSSKEYDLEELKNNIIPLSSIT